MSFLFSKAPSVQTTASRKPASPHRLKPPRFRQAPSHPPLDRERPETRGKMTCRSASATWKNAKGERSTQFSTQLDKTNHNGPVRSLRKSQRKCRIYRHFRTRRNGTGRPITNYLYGS